MKRSRDDVRTSLVPYQAVPVNEYRPTIIESGILVERLAREIKFFHRQFKNFFAEFKQNPKSACRRVGAELNGAVRRIWLAPNVIASCVTSLFFVSAIVLLVFIIDKRAGHPVTNKPLGDETDAAVRIIDLTKADAFKKRESSGMGSTGRVGYNRSRGEGSNEERRRAQGGGSGGNKDLTEAQRGKLPAPSAILAAIPKTPPLHPPALPAAGVDLDPALWRDLKFPVYGNPQSQSEIPSNGPGTGGGMGNNRGLGVGTGDGPGVGSGSGGNTGGGPKQIGCCGSGGGSDGERVV